MREVVMLRDLSLEQAAPTPRFARGAMTQAVPKYELLLDGSPRLHLATFVRASRPLRRRGRAA